MKLGVVSDVHNNLEALRYALEQLRGCELVVSLGDLLSDYRTDLRVLHLAREAGLLSIVGNHEKSILLHPGSQVRPKLPAEDLDQLRELPPQRTLAVAGRRVHLAHGAPWDDPADYHCAYVYAHDQASLERVAASAQAEVVLLGHTHQAMAVRLHGTLVVNPGSCGEARDRAGQLSFAELDAAAGVATIYAVRQGRAPEPLFRQDF